MIFQILTIALIALLAWAISNFVVAYFTNRTFRDGVNNVMRNPRLIAIVRHPATRTVAVVALVALIFVVPMVANAQSIGIEFTEDDLAVFFTWFNTIFNALLPIALLGAGLTAGGLFVWVIANMLIRAFQGMLSGGARSR